jgi:CsoR family transcriptional regulator, copper-sensing transcriptional repressor
MASAKATPAAACACGAHTRPNKAAGVDPEIKTANLNRLRRIEGQIRGLERMVEADRYCPDILVQLSSAQEALRAVGQALMRNHLRHCVTKTIRKGSQTETDATFDELLHLIYTHAR